MFDKGTLPRYYSIGFNNGSGEMMIKIHKNLVNFWNYSLPGYNSEWIDALSKDYKIKSRFEISLDDGFGIENCIRKIGCSGNFYKYSMRLPQIPEEIPIKWVSWLGTLSNLRSMPANFPGTECNLPQTIQLSPFGPMNGWLSKPLVQWLKTKTNLPECANAMESAWSMLNQPISLNTSIQFSAEGENYFILTCPGRQSPRLVINKINSTARSIIGTDHEIEFPYISLALYAGFAKLVQLAEKDISPIPI